MRKIVKISNITCTQCAKSIENHFSKIDEIDAKVLVTSKKVIFNYNANNLNLEIIYKELQKIGYYPIIDSESQLKAKRRDLIDFWVATIFTLPLLWTMFAHLNIPVYTPHWLMNGYVQLGLTIPVQFFVGRRFFKAAYYQIRNKSAGMDVLVVVGTMAAFIYSLYLTIYDTIHYQTNHPHLYFEVSAVIIYMVLIGNFFEARVKEKTADSLQALMSLGVKEARVLVNDNELMLPIDEIKVGDVIIVLPNEKVPLDGVIISGQTYLDESMLTGESIPVFREMGTKVIGSALNIVETIQIEVTAVGTDTVLAQIIQAVEEVSLYKPKAQRIADKISAYFVPTVVIIALITFAIQWSVNDLSLGFRTAIAVLAISCPCALGLATPTSISVSSGVAFRRGILYKGGEFFEKAHSINAIAFDKTGTLTIGSPTVVDFYGTKSSFLYTKSLEVHSNHPLAVAIKEYNDDDVLNVLDFEVLMGIGIKGVINNKTVLVGSLRLLNQLKLVNHFEEEYLRDSKQGKTVIFTIIDDEVVNMISIIDPLKEDAKNLISLLKARKIKPYMITGDQKDTANYIASLIGIDDVYAEVLPHEKSKVIESIRNQGYVVSMVGDGINDAPALKMADVGIVVSTGTDIALDSADVVLKKNDLTLVLDAIDLSRATLINIYFNFFWAFIYNIVMIPVAAMGYITPALAGIGMGFSSIAVILNALALNLFQFKKYKGEK